MKDYGLSEVQTLNTNMKNWIKEDYLHAYCDLKYPEYLKMRNFMRQYPDFGLAAALALLKNQVSHSDHVRDITGEITGVKGGKYVQHTFQNGEFKIYDYPLSQENAERILMIKPYYDGFNRRAFVAALIAIFKLEHFDHAQFLTKLSYNATSLQHCANSTQNRMLIEDIYNIKSRDKVSLRF